MCVVDNPVVEASMPIPEQLMQECRNEVGLYKNKKCTSSMV